MYHHHIHHQTPPPPSLAFFLYFWKRNFYLKYPSYILNKKKIFLSFFVTLLLQRHLLSTYHLYRLYNWFFAYLSLFCFCCCVCKYNIHVYVHIPMYIYIGVFFSFSLKSRFYLKPTSRAKFILKLLVVQKTKNWFLVAQNGSHTSNIRT